MSVVDRSSSEFSEYLELYERAPLLELGHLADAERWRQHPENVVTYIIDRNINYTNVCVADCKFCAFYRRPKHPEGYVLSFEQIGATPLIARELQLELGQPVVRFRRQLLADGEPMSVDENFIPAHRVRGILDDPPPASLYNVLSEKYGLVMEWGEDTIEATAASPSIARLLNVEMGAPLLKIQRHAYVARAMVDYSVSYYRADRYKLWVPLQRPGARTPRAYTSNRLR